MAYLRNFKVRSYRGQVYEYVHLVESYYEDGRNKQRILVNFGRKDLLAPHLEALSQIAARNGSRRGASRIARAGPLTASCWGPVLALRTLWNELQLDSLFDRLDGAVSRDATSLADRSFVLVAYRLISPTGGAASLARWLETDYVCDRRGRRWKPRWRNAEERRKRPSSRKRVAPVQLQRWRRTVDHLAASRKRIELELYRRLREKLPPRIDLVIRDAPTRGPQAAVTIVLADGWPLVRYVANNKRRGRGAAPRILDDLRQRFEVRRLVFMGERGVWITKNLDFLHQRRRGDVTGADGLLAALDRCPAETSADESPPAPIRVREIDDDGSRAYLIECDERRAFERAAREKAMKQIRRELERIRTRVAKGRLKASEKVAAAATDVLSRNHGGRYYDWEYSPDGVFRYFEHPVRLRREQSLEGYFVVRTDDPGLGPEEAARTYESLGEVEPAFRMLEENCPFSFADPRAESTLEAFSCVESLAFLLQRALERKLRAAGSRVTARQALEILRTVCVVDFHLGAGTTERTVSHGSSLCVPVLRALGVTPGPPPPPPADQPEIT